MPKLTSVYRLTLLRHRKAGTVEKLYSKTENQIVRLKRCVCENISWGIASQPDDPDSFVFVKGNLYPRPSLKGTASYRGFIIFLQDLLQNIWLSLKEGINGLGNDG